MLNKVKKINGFTLVETLISIGIALIVIIGMTVAATFAIKFNALATTKNLAQEVARNSMNKEVRNTSFDTINALMTTTGQAFTITTGTPEIANEGRVILFDGTRNPFTATTVTTTTEASKTIHTIAKTLTSSSLYDDLKKLHNAKCAMIVTPVIRADGTTSPNSYNVKVKVWWNLADDGTNTSGTRNVELFTILSYGDLNSARYVMSRPSTGVIPGEPTATPTATSVPTATATPTASPTGIPTPTPSPGPTATSMCLAVQASCITGGTCCTGLTCTPAGICLSCIAVSGKVPAGCSCQNNGDCIGGQCGTPIGSTGQTPKRCL